MNTMCLCLTKEEEEEKKEAHTATNMESYQ